MHDHLIALGFLDQVSEVDSGQLFPELRRKSRRANLGDSISYHWRNSLMDRLGPKAAGKSFHSFRHYVTDELRYEQRIPDLWRHHILGHALASEEDRRYGRRTPLKLLQPVINALPQVFY